jgi:hypothetical protein
MLVDLGDLFGGWFKRRFVRGAGGVGEASREVQRAGGNRFLLAVRVV